MGLNYSLVAIIPRSRSSGMLSRLGTILTPESAERIAHLEWQPLTESVRRTDLGPDDVDARGILGVTPEQDAGETENYFCLSLLIKLEREMEAYVKGHDFRCFDQPGQFGCMYASVHAGAEFVLLELMAPTSGMSRVLLDSTAVHELWRSFARSAGALVAYVDVEDIPAAEQVFPYTYSLKMPDFRTLAFSNDCRISIDRLAQYIKAVNGL